MSAEELLASAVDALRSIATVDSKRQRHNSEIALNWLLAHGYPLKPGGYVPGVGFEEATGGRHSILGPTVVVDGTCLYALKQRELWHPHPSGRGIIVVHPEKQPQWVREDCGQLVSSRISLEFQLENPSVC